MAWTAMEWSCGHTGSKKLYGARSDRQATVAWEAGRCCFGCWLLKEWDSTGDPRALRADRWNLAEKIAGGKGILLHAPAPQQVPAPSDENMSLGG